MTDQSHNIATSESAGAVSELVTASSTKAPAALTSTKQTAQISDKAPGWELRLFIRALLAQNLKSLLNLTGHTQQDLKIYTGLAKQTVITACSLEQNLSKLSQSAFKNNTFALTMCSYVDDCISALNNSNLERNMFISKLVDCNSKKYAELIKFLQDEKLKPEQIEEFAKKLCSQQQLNSENYNCPTFKSLWLRSFQDFETDIVRELRGQRFKDIILGTYGADSFNFTTARNVYFDLVFLQQADLGCDVFMYPLLQCMMHNKVRCLFDFEQLDNFKILMNDHWNDVLEVLISCKDALSDPNLSSDDANNIADSINQHLQFIPLISKLLRNLAILRELKLIHCRDVADSSKIDLLLNQNFAAKEYLEQAVHLIDDIISGINSFSKRSGINLASVRSFLNNLDTDDGKTFYIFTATFKDYWDFHSGIYGGNSGLDLNYNLELRHDNGCDLFCHFIENDIDLHKSIHVLKYNTSRSANDKPLILSLELIKPYDKSQFVKRHLSAVHGDFAHISLFNGKLNTYYKLSKYGVEIDSTKGGATNIAKLHLDPALQSVINKLSGTYYCSMLDSIICKPWRRIEMPLQVQVANMVDALNYILERSGGFEG